MKPIGKRLREESRSSVSKIVNEVKLFDLDAQIAELENALNSDSDSDQYSDCDDNVNSSIIENNESMIIEKDSNGNIIRMTSTNLKSEELIEPLPKIMLPLPQNRKNSHSASISNSDRKRKITFAINEEDSKLPNEESRPVTKALVEDFKHNYQAASQNKVPFWCRCCQWSGANFQEFENHKKSSEHKKALHIERAASACKMCKKQFTSPDQLKEHLKGNAHKQKLEYVKSLSSQRGRFS